ncbi:HWE histidine kinase domain-containing protein [Hyphococcus sp.]|uniref:HWE histidine kinase domain-containing protein n=1 Tax=Hyphococcus sp. TaxID=2038636 RepID=UPI003D0AABDF
MARRNGSLEADYLQLEADFHVMANSIPQLAWMTRPDGWIFWYNQRWFDYTGTTLEEMEGWGWRRVHHQDHVERVVAKIKNAFETGEPWEDVFPLRGKDGKYRWFLSRALPIRNAKDEIVRWFGTNTDVTEQKETEERQTLLMREIDHRAKNALAVAQAVVNLTTADTIESYKAAVQGRIAALSRAHNLLAASRWEGADLRSILEDELSPYIGDDAGRVLLEGRTEVLPPPVAQSLALILHELVTNAAKYGALSTSKGKLSVTWRRADDGLSIEWRESGGPPVAPPAVEGFGTTLLSSLVDNFEGGAIDRIWEPEGLVCNIALRARPALSAAPAGAAKPKAKAKKTPQTPVSILIVEDEALTALDLEMRLRAAGFAIAGAVGSLDRAREVMADTLPDLAVLDGNLNGERSYPLAEELLAAGVPVVFCTGYERMEDQPESLSACPVIVKPVSDEALMAAIRSSLGKS